MATSRLTVHVPPVTERAACEPRQEDTKVCTPRQFAGFVDSGFPHLCGHRICLASSSCENCSKARSGTEKAATPKCRIGVINCEDGGWHCATDYLTRIT